MIHTGIQPTGIAPKSRDKELIAEAIRKIIKVGKNEIPVSDAVDFIRDSNLDVSFVDPADKNSLHALDRISILGMSLVIWNDELWKRMVDLGGNIEGILAYSDAGMPMNIEHLCAAQTWHPHNNPNHMRAYAASTDRGFK